MVLHSNLELDVFFRGSYFFIIINTDINKSSSHAINNGFWFKDQIFLNRVSKFWLGDN